MNILDLDSNPHDKHIQELRNIFISFQNNQQSSAKQRLKKRIKKYPSDDKSHMLQSFIAEAEGNLPLALKTCETAIQIAPKTSTYNIRAGALAQKIAAWDKAEKYYLAYLDQNPSHTTTIENLIDVFQTQQKEKDTFSSLLSLARSQEPKPHHKQLLFKYCTQYQLTHFGKATYQSLLQLLSYPQINLASLAGNLGNYIEETYQLKAKDKNIDLAQASKDQLFLKSLKSIRFTSPNIELLITTLREVLLLLSIQNNELDKNFQPLAAAIALNAYLTEYVFFVKPDEKRLIEDIKQLIEVQFEQGAELADVEELLMLLSLYEPLFDQSFSEHILKKENNLVNENLKAIISTTLHAPLQEQALQKNIASQQTISDKVSLAVQEHYEENPYPRWVSTYQAPITSLYDALRQQTSHDITVPENLKKSDLNILIAGCGTGHQPISLAMQLPDAKITAIDLSRPSLAYAMRKANQLNCENIHFYQDDILNINADSGYYDYIECGGVLHHMNDPIQGWKSLLGALKVDGVMKIGLYSEMARRHITHERKKIAQLNLKPTPDTIRKYRQALLHQQPPSPIPISVTDFYSLSECRDLIFHQHEQCFTWLSIRDICEELELELLSVSGKGKIVENYLSSFDYRNTITFDELDRFERENPDAFIGMYQFYVTRAKK